MLILNILDTLYENSYFSKFLLCSIIVLIVLFLVVLILGIRDKNRALRPKEEVEEDVKDITFNNTPIDIDTLKEDVTFEMPSLTQNLEKFKKNLEEEILNEDMAEVRKTSGIILPKENKKIKVLDREKIEDTNIAPIKDSVDKEKHIENKENSKKSNNGKDSSLKNAPSLTNNGQEKSKESFKNHKKHNILEEKLFKHKKNVQVPSIKDNELINPQPEKLSNIENNNKQSNNTNSNSIQDKNKNYNVNSNQNKNTNQQINRSNNSSNNNQNKKNGINNNANINENDINRHINFNQNNDITKKETTTSHKNSFNTEEENIKNHPESEVLGIYNTDDDF